MDNNAWKKERDLLKEAYKTIYEDHEEEDEEEESEIEEAAPEADEEEIEEVEESIPEVGKLGDPVDTLGGPLDPPSSSIELDAEVESLKNLLLNPPKDKIQEYAKNGRLGEYIEMLQQKLKTAESMKKLYSPEGIES